MAKLSAEEIRLRGVLLGENKELLKLHRELVMSGKITEEEFWETRKGLLENQQVQLQLKKAPTTSSLLGIDIKPQADIQGDLKFVLTPSLIKSIFEQTPIIRRAYTEKVPGVVDEKTFWMQYFTSKFFQEGLSTGSGTLSEKTSPSGNLFDEYYQESQLEAEGSLRLKPVENLPISIDIMATTEDHYQAADPNARPAEPMREERAKTAAIRRLNKLSSSIVESSGTKRLETAIQDEALLAHEQGERYIPLELKESAVDPKNDFIIDDAHLERLTAQWTPPTASTITPVSYQDYSTAMSAHRSKSARNPEQTFKPKELTVIGEDAYHTWITNLIELLRQFWSAYPPGANKELQARIERLSRIIREMVGDLERWCQSAAASSREREFLVVSLGNLKKAAEFAVEKHQALANAPAAPTAPKRAKTT